MHLVGSIIYLTALLVFFLCFPGIQFCHYYFLLFFSVLVSFSTLSLLSVNFLPHIIRHTVTIRYREMVIYSVLQFCLLVLLHSSISAFVMIAISFAQTEISNLVVSTEDTITNCLEPFRFQCM